MKSRLETRLSQDVPPTRSVWGATPSFFYRFIARMEASISHRPLQWCILGCSDGKFVVPVARRKHRVLAIDLDRTALFGGEDIDGSGKILKVPGLENRLKAWKIEKRVEIKCKNYLTYRPKRKFDVVFTSGSIHYPVNESHSLELILSGMQRYVRPGGFLLIDYMHSLEPTTNKKRTAGLYVDRAVLERYFEPTNWSRVYSRVMSAYEDEPHVGTPFPHMHRIGFFCVRRKK